MTTQITFAAPILLPGDPSTGKQASTKDYADTKVPQSRTVSAGTGLTGGGALSADIAFSVAYGSTSTTACVGNDTRLTDARTPTAHKSTHATGGTDALSPSDIGAQPVDSDLTTIAGLTATTDNFLQAKASAWASRTPAQVAADLVTPLSSSLQPLDSDLTAIAGLTPGSGNVLAADGSGWISKTYAALKTALGLVKGDVGLGNVDNTSDATKNAAAVTLTNKTLTSPVINSPTGIVKGDVGLGNVDNTSDSSKNSATATLTNKRITKRVGTTASSSTPTADADSHDMYTVTAAAANMTVGSPTGTPTDGQMLLYRFKDNGTARTLAWNAIFRAVGVTLPTTTVISKTLYVGTIYNSADSKWDAIAVALEA